MPQLEQFGPPGARVLLLLARHGWLPFLTEHGGFQGAPEAIQAGELSGRFESNLLCCQGMELVEYDPELFADAQAHGVGSG